MSTTFDGFTLYRLHSQFIYLQKQNLRSFYSRKFQFSGTCIRLFTYRIAALLVHFAYFPQDLLAPRSSLLPQASKGTLYLTIPPKIQFKVQWLSRTLNLKNSRIFFSKSPKGASFKKSQTVPLFLVDSGIVPLVGSYLSAKGKRKSQ